MRQIIGANLNRWMHKRNISQARMADKIGRCENCVSRWANGKSLPDAESLYKMAKVLRIDLMDLYKGVDDEYRRND